VKQNIDLSRLLRAVDRRILILIIIGVLATFLLQNFVINPSDRDIASSSAEQVTLQEETASLEQRVQEIISGGTQSIEDISARVDALERVIPTSVDDLVLTAELFQLAGESVLIGSVLESEEQPTKPKTGLNFMRYEIKGSTSLGSLGQFLQVIALTGRHIITVEELTVTVGTQRNNATQPGQPAAAASGVTTSPVINFDAKVRVWFDDTTRLLSPAAPAGGTTPAATPGNPGANTPTDTATGVQPGGPAVPGQGDDNTVNPQQPNTQPTAQPTAQASPGGLVPGQQVLPGQPTGN
jgi:Tfp pilus assembly protein PilO